MYLQHLCDIEDHDTPRVQEIIDNKFQTAYTRWRYTLHVAYKSLEAKGINPRSVSPRGDVTLEKWQLACDFMEDLKYKVIFFQLGKMFICISSYFPPLYLCYIFI